MKKHSSDSNDDGGIRLRNRLITDMHAHYHPLYVSILSRFTLSSTREKQDIIQSFVAKRLCALTPSKLKELIEKGPVHMRVVFKNFVIDELRIDKRYQVNYDYFRADTRGQSSSDQHTLESDDAWAHMQQEILEKFGERYLKVFIMHKEGYSTKEIADIMDTTPNNIRVMIHRIRTYLKN